MKKNGTIRQTQVEQDNDSEAAFLEEAIDRPRPVDGHGSFH
jgi:hypothetical protein